MGIEIVTKEDLENFRLRLLKDIAQLLKPEDSNTTWLKSYEVREMLKISAGSLMRLRIKGILPYVKVGGIFLYNKGAVTKVLLNLKGR